MQKKNNFTDTKLQNKRRMGVKAQTEELTSGGLVTLFDCGKECVDKKDTAICQGSFQNAYSTPHLTTSAAFRLPLSADDHTFLRK